MPRAIYLLALLALLALACGESTEGSDAETQAASGMPSAAGPATQNTVAPTSPTTSEPGTPAPVPTPNGEAGSPPSPSPDPVPAASAGAGGMAGSPGDPDTSVSPPVGGGGAGAAGSSDAGRGGVDNAAGVPNAGSAGEVGRAGASVGGVGGFEAVGGTGPAGAAGTGTIADAVAIATLSSTGVDSSHDDISGSATFTQVGDEVTLVLVLQGCPMGPHISHIHENPDCGNEGNAAGLHWLPNGELIEDYGCDSEGNAVYTLTVDGGQWTVAAGDDDSDVDGHSFMVHLGSSVSPGDRVACGVIEPQ